MAVRRVLSLMAAKLPLKPTSTELSRDFHPSPKTFFSCYEKYTRGLQTLVNSSTPPIENPTQPESSSSSVDPGKINTLVSNSINDETSIQHIVNSKLKISERHDLVMVYTCKVCETRSIKSVCRSSYEKGVVVTRCEGCKNLHLIADRLGWFGQPGSVEEFLAARGEEVKKGSTDTLSLTLEDLAGKKST